MPDEPLRNAFWKALGQVAIGTTAHERRQRFYCALLDFSAMTHRITGRPVSIEQEHAFYQDYCDKHGDPLA